jgi:hypothetical protein
MLIMGLDKHFLLKSNKDKIGKILSDNLKYEIEFNLRDKIIDKHDSTKLIKFIFYLIKTIISASPCSTSLSNYKPLP